MPPEYVQFGKISIKTDAFAFGLCLFELLTGRRPNSGDLAEEVAEQIAGAGEDEAADFAAVLDSSAAEWPVADALAVGRLGLRCQERFAKQRASVAEVLPALEALV